MSEVIDFWKSIYKHEKTEYLTERNTTLNLYNRLKVLRLSETNYISSLAEDVLNKQTIYDLKFKIGNKNILVIRHLIQETKSEEERKEVIDELWLTIGYEIIRYFNNNFPEFDQKEISLMWPLIVKKLME